MIPYHKTICILAVLFTLSSCKNLRKEKTTIEVIDNNRHYYPILAGQKLNMVFVVKNTGKAPFILSDLFTSCGCLTSDKSSIKAIPPGKEGNLILQYNSIKNVGLVQQYITIYGNLATSDKYEITFDIHVVPNGLYTKDFEEMYEEEKQKDGGIKNMVDGNENNKGYYVN